MVTLSNIEEAELLFSVHVSAWQTEHDRIAALRAIAPAEGTRRVTTAQRSELNNNWHSTWATAPVHHRSADAYLSTYGYTYIEDSKSRQNN